MRRYLIFISLCMTFLVNAQTREERVYYDSEDDARRIKAIYHVNDKDPTVLEGEYRSFFENGNLSTIGDFVNNQKSGLWKYFYENGQLKMDAAFSGEEAAYWRYYYESGVLKKEGGIKDDQRVGKWVFYYENGKTKSGGEFQEGLKEGTWKYFYEDSVLRASAHYEQGRGRYTEYYYTGEKKMEGQIKDNHSDGIWTHYYKNGNVSSKGYEKDGVKNGYWVYYHENGQKSGEGNYSDGVLDGEWSYYHESGQVSSEGDYSVGLKDGYWKLYHENGGFKADGIFEKGTGDYTEYYENNRIKVKGQFKEDKNDSTWNYYYEDGTLEGTCDFLAGKGIYKGFYKNGDLKMKGKIVDGNKVGTWEIYGKDGEVIGYHKTVYPDVDAPVFRDDSLKNVKIMNLDNLSDLAPEDSLIDSTLIDQKYDYTHLPDYRNPTRQRMFRKAFPHFNPRPREFRGTVASLNPLATFVANSLPISMEYYVQERIGYAFNYTVLRGPFFLREAKLTSDQVYLRGGVVGTSIRFYNSKKQYGIPFYGHELRYKFRMYQAQTIDTLPDFTIQTNPRLQESELEYSMIFGIRLVQRDRDVGFVMDLFGGAGVRYIVTNRYYNQTDLTDELFGDIDKSPLGVNPRVGIMFGYLF